ncbi:MAG: hypothetical protein AAGJ69_10975, partial [Cyanobacteria bacterium J06559_1]
LLTTVGFQGSLALSAQLVTPAIAAEETPSNTPIDLELNAQTDRATSMPSDRTQSDDPVGDSRVPVGLDERVPVLNREFPWSAIGRLEWQYEGQIISTCTATLIDADLLLTNSHCLMLPRRNDQTGETTPAFVNPEQYERIQAEGDGELKIVFKPSMINGIALDEANVVTYQAGWSNEANGATEDWAVLQIDADLGEQYGYLGWRNLDLENNNVLGALSENTLLAGYSGDFPTAGLSEFGEPSDTAGVDLACSILGIAPEGVLADTIIHDCDTNPGASGAPILAEFADGDYYIIGLHARQVPLNRTATLPNGVETEVLNGGVRVSNWAPTAFQMISSVR